MGARHLDDASQAACWPGRPLVSTRQKTAVTCCNCTRTRVYRDAPADPPELDEVLSAQIRRRNPRTIVRRRLARELGKCRPEDPQDSGWSMPGSSGFPPDR